MYYWVEIEGQPAFCVAADNETQCAFIVLKEKYTVAKRISVLPYPANPALRPNDFTVPAFCWNPNGCKGHTSCPRNPSCTS